MPFPIELAYRAFCSSPSDPGRTESELLRDRSIWYSVQIEHRWVIDLFNTMSSSYGFRGSDPVKDGTAWRVLPSLMLGVLRVVSQSVRVGLVRIVMEPETRYIR